MRLSGFYILEQTSGGPWELGMELPADPRSVSVPRQIDNVARWMDGGNHTMPSAAGRPLGAEAGRRHSGRLISRSSHGQSSSRITCGMTASL